MKTTFEKTTIQQLYRRAPIGVYYSRQYIDGKTKWLSLKTKIFDVARIKVAQAKLQAVSAPKINKAVRSVAVTMGELAEVYLRTVELRGDIKASTKGHLKKTVLYLFRSWPSLADTLPGKVTREDCQEWAARYRERYSEPFYNTSVDSLRHVFEAAINRGLIIHNPAKAVTKVRVPQKKLELPSTAQFHAIVAAIRDAGSANSQGSGDLVEFLAYSGTRISEAGRVRWQDVDYARVQIYIAKGKNSKDRYIPIIPQMRDLLLRIQALPRWFRAKHRHDAGCIVSVAKCQEALTAACQKVGAPRITHHDMRHLFATQCIETGVDIPTLSRWLGHSDGGALAMRTYGHLRKDHSLKMGEKVIF
jgi:integrase